MSLVATVCLLIGSAFVLVAAVGLVRLPDLMMRMHAATKAATLGAGLLLVAVAVAQPDPGVIARVVAIVVFMVLTAPIAAHVIARAAYHCGEASLWERSCVDELADHLAAHRSPNQAVRTAVEEREGASTPPSAPHPVSSPPAS